MDVLYDIKLTQCEHVLVNTLKFTNKCYKCKQLKWLWSKAVGCINCGKVWHRRCLQPATVGVESAGQRDADVVVTTSTVGEAEAFVEDESSAVGAVATVQGTFSNQAYGKTDSGQTAGGSAVPEPGGQLLRPVSPESRRPVIGHPIESRGLESTGGAARVISLDSWPVIGHLQTIKWPKLRSAGACLERFIAQRSWPVLVQTIKWPKSHARAVPSAADAANWNGLNVRNSVGGQALTAVE